MTLTADCDCGYPLWRTGEDGHGLYLVQAGPLIWLGYDMLQDLLDAMPLFPVALVAADFTGCPRSHYVPGPGSTGAILVFRLDGGRRLVYRIAGFSWPRLSYELRWPD